MSNSEFNFETTFPPLGHPEHHFNKYPDHPWLKTEKEIKSWLLKNSDILKENIYINEDLTVTINLFGEGDLEIKVGENSKERIEYLPIQIKHVNDLTIKKIGLKSLIGSPYCAVSMDAGSNEVKSWTGISGNVKNIYLGNNKFKSFKGMPNCNLESPFIDISENSINSWDGFTKAKEINLALYKEEYLFENDNSENKIENIKRMVSSLPENIVLLFASICLEKEDNPFEEFADINTENYKRMIFDERLNNFRFFRLVEFKLNKIRDFQKVNKSKVQIEKIEFIDKSKKRKL